MEKRILLDGAMGTELMKRGLRPGAFPEQVNVLSAETVRDIHRAYVEAGSEIVYANTFGANPLKARGAEIAPVIAAGLENARIAADGRARTALDVGPLGQLLEPFGDLSEERARDCFRQVFAAGTGAELVALETFFDLQEALLALETAKTLLPGVPCFVTMTFQPSGRTLTGTTPAEAARELTAAGADAVGLNCSLGPVEALPMLRTMRDATGLPLIAKPNAGIPDAKTGVYPMDAAAFAAAMEPVAAIADYVGGCCGTDPDYIRALGRIFG